MKTEPRTTCAFRQVAARLPWLAPLALALGCWSAQAPDELARTSEGDPARAGSWPSRVIPNGPNGPSDMPSGTGPKRPDGLPEAFTMIDPTELRRRLWTEPPPSAYVPPSPERARAFAAFMRKLLAAPTPAPEALRDLAWAAGFELHAWYVDGQRLLAAVEPKARQSGAGAYLVRVATGKEPGRPVILQAPHAFHDLGTERIALALALRGGPWPRALFVNTVHRYLDTDGERRRQSAAPADPCHNPDHLFAVATAAALDVLPRAEVLQLHGFADGDEALGPAAVISAGDRLAASARTRQVSERLRTALGVEVALFPVDRTRFGATSNAQGRLIRARGGPARFVHVELSHELRRRLQKDARALASLADALRPDDLDPEETLTLAPERLP